MKDGQRMKIRAAIKLLDEVMEENPSRELADASNALELILEKDG